MITQAPAESEPIVALATSNHNMPAGRSGRRRHELCSRAVCRLTSACGERARGEKRGREGGGGEVEGNGKGGGGKREDRE